MDSLIEIKAVFKFQAFYFYFYWSIICLCVCLCTYKNFHNQSLVSVLVAEIWNPFDLLYSLF